MRSRDMCKAARCDFTSGAYGHVTARMKRESAFWMEKFIQSSSKPERHPKSRFAPHKGNLKGNHPSRSENKIPQPLRLRDFLLEVTPGFEPGNQGFADSFP